MFNIFIQFKFLLKIINSVQAQIKKIFNLQNEYDCSLINEIKQFINIIIYHINYQSIKFHIKQNYPNQYFIYVTNWTMHKQLN